MSRTESSADRLLHPALSPAEGVELAAAHCTDRAKLGVVLQAAGLLSLCDAAGWSLADGWSGARVDATGRLNGLAVRPGRDRSAVQPRLSDLLLRLFRARGRVAGRGEARRAARTLTELWESSMVPMSSDDAIALLFESAPFLWDADLTSSRDALRGAFERAGGRTDWFAGPPVVRRLLGGNAPLRGATAAELAFRGRWSDAVRLWRDYPPAIGTEQLAFAEALYAIGRFEAALLVVTDRDDSAAVALRAGCRLLLGELGAARELVERLRVRPLDIAELLEHGDLALRIFALGGDADAERDWTARALAAARSPAERLRAQLLAATAAMDAGDLAGAERHVESAPSAVSRGGEDDWRRHEVRGWLAQARGDGAAMVEHSRALLRARRRRMRRFEAGRAWNNLGLGYLYRGELAAAERAFEQSARLLRRCDGPLAVTLPLSNLAEARLRAGKIVDVEPILKASMSHNRRSGNSRGLQLDEALWIRLELVRGAPEVALERAERLERTLARRPSSERPPFAVLAARAAGWLERPGDAASWLARAGEAELAELDPEELPGLHALAGDLDRARQLSADGPFAALWNAIGRGEAPAGAALRAFDELEPYRRARLALDVELLAPGSLPAAARDAAASRFRRIGARRYAALFEREAGGLWSALRTYLETAPDEPAAAADPGELLRAAGHPEAALLLREGESERVLASGEGETAEEISAAVDGGTLILRAARIDEPLRALFALLRRDAAGRHRGDPAAAANESAIRGQSPLLLAAIDRLRQFAPSSMPVLILGESGTGKELAAKEIRRGSPRAAGAWVAVNCAALSETLLLSDLFGHARGAYTGADRPHAGVFETAHGGTVFLDEIGDLPPVAQGNLLRVLQEGEIRRLGESLPRKVDVRLVAATHRDLGALAREGKFRQDLYYRLKVCTVTLPPLRARGADVELLAELFLESERRELGRPLLRLTSEARRRLAAHAWPGNVRELQHVVRAAAALAGDGPIGPDLLDLEAGSGELPVGDYHRDVYEFRRSLVARALAASKGNRAAAARQLGLSRQALSYLVRELDLTDERTD